MVFRSVARGEYERPRARRKPSLRLALWPVFKSRPPPGSFRARRQPVGADRSGLRRGSAPAIATGGGGGHVPKVRPYRRAGYEPAMVGNEDRTVNAAAFNVRRARRQSRDRRLSAAAVCAVSDQNVAAPRTQRCAINRHPAMSASYSVYTLNRTLSARRLLTLISRCPRCGRFTPDNGHWSARPTNPKSAMNERESTA